MSLYPQSTAYTQVSYPTQGYVASVPPPNPYSYAPPTVQQPYYHVDPNIFRRDYAAQLSRLTVNSRPIIQHLSMIAQDYSRMFSDVIVQTIEQHIRRVPALMKLPAFYLLDAISKNVFDPYARLFKPVVVRLFIDTYDVVDPSLRSKMEEMLLTWRTGAPDRTELFGQVNQLAIERHIWGDASQTSGRRGGEPPVSQAQVLSELEFILNQKERARQENPHDTLVQNHVNILHQLRTLVQAGVSPDELSQILSQLRNLAKASISPPAPAPPPPVYEAPSTYAPPPPMPMAPPPVPQVSYPTQPAYTSSYEQHTADTVDLSRLLAAQSAPVASTSAAPSVPNIANLYSALVKAGFVPGANGSTDVKMAQAEEPAKPANPGREASRSYRQLVLGQKIRLTSGDITRHRPPIVEMLYGRLPIQCKQCAARFSDDASGKKQFEEHLDMHFRQNRKANQAVGRGHSRGWFISMDDWTYNTSIDVKGKGRADGRTVHSKAAAAEDAAKLEAELRAMYVVVPPGDEAKAISCPICKEPLKSEFLEDDEEWVWRNAIKKEERIYHATCHAEALASKSSLASRLRNDAGSRSRSRTPEKRTPPKVHAALNGESRQSETPTPSKLAGTKRKAEDDSLGLVKSDGDAPQVKRFAT